MAIKNSESVLVSFESEVQKKALRKIIQTEGKFCNVFVKTKNIHNVQVITSVHSMKEAVDGDFHQMTAKDCYNQLKKQDSIF